MTISKRVFNGRCAIAAVTVAAIGGAVALGMLEAARTGQGPWVPEGKNFVIASCIGACLGGWASTWAFGRSGAQGWLLALCGAFVATILGGAVAGTLYVPALGTMMGALTVFEAMFQNPDILLGWGAMRAVVQLVMLRWAPYRVGRWSGHQPETDSA